MHGIKAFRRDDDDDVGDDGCGFGVALLLIARQD